ncbi:spermine/spermidine synthase domain-containing protein [Ramlibacter alkalitolerans]|uniref:Spermidine synthase n=1 Tax=Ramlibacter alkalitolerans TaxID=2039631 RepID=A0ABS1JH20_9BURK|nr:spermidine synthase [Ramlibacter alkalitolerans]MBL0423523.1 spermidine synthase [Ramlibacter alkalitolerans]
MDIVITEAEGLRLLQFGTSWCQGAMRMADPDRLELAYAVRMFAWLLFHDSAGLAGKHLVTLGLGAGSLTRFAHRVLGMRTTAVEIDARVIDACRTHFLLPRDGDGLRIVHADAAAFVADPANARSCDVLQVDAYDASVERPALDSQAFYADCRSCLREGGTLAANLIGRALDVRASVARLRAGLQPRAIWQFPPTQAGNVVVVAHCGGLPPEDVLAARASAIEARWELPAPSWLAMARRSPGHSPPEAIRR